MHTSHQRQMLQGSRTRNAISGNFRSHQRTAFKPFASISASSTSFATVQQVNEVYNWCKSKSASVEKVTVSSSLDDGKGILIAAKDIAPGEAVFTVPDSVWLSADAIKKTNIGKAVENLEPWLQIALLLIASKSNSTAAGDWSTYIKSLPTKTNSPLEWTAEQQSMLQGTQAYDTMQGYL